MPMAEFEDDKPNNDISLIRYLMGVPSDECAKLRSQLINWNYDKRTLRIVGFLLSCRERSAPIVGEEVAEMDALLKGEL